MKKNGIAKRLSETITYEYIDSEDASTVTSTPVSLYTENFLITSSSLNSHDKSKGLDSEEKKSLLVLEEVTKETSRLAESTIDWLKDERAAN